MCLIHLVNPNADCLYRETVVLHITDMSTYQTLPYHAWPTQGGPVDSSKVERGLTLCGREEDVTYLLFGRKGDMICKQRQHHS